MGVNLPDVHARSLAATRDVFAGVSADQWSDPSVCEGWTLRELGNHIVSGNYWAAELVGGKTIDEVGDRLDGDLLGEDPLAKYDESARLAGKAFNAPGAMEAPCAVSYGPVPGEVYCGHRFLDVLVHGWDLAKSTGQDTKLDPELVDACVEVITPQLDMLVASGMFGTSRPPAAGADGQTQLLLMLGREP